MDSGRDWTRRKQNLRTIWPNTKWRSKPSRLRVCRLLSEECLFVTLSLSSYSSVFDRIGLKFSNQNINSWRLGHRHFLASNLWENFSIEFNSRLITLSYPNKMMRILFTSRWCSNPLTHSGLCIQCAFLEEPKEDWETTRKRAKCKFSSRRTQLEGNARFTCQNLWAFSRASEELLRRRRESNDGLLHRHIRTL